MKVPEQIRQDVDQIIELVTGVCYDDELSLLRISIRAYLDGATPEEAVSFASGKLSDAITHRNDHKT